MAEQILSNNPDEDIAPISPFGAIDYGVTEDELEKLANSFADITEITNRKEYDKAQAAITKLTRARTDVEKRRKELKSESLAFGRLVDSTGKELMAVVEPEEQRLKALVDKVKAQKAAEKAERERIELERVTKITDAISDITRLPDTLLRSGSEQVLEARDDLEKLEITADNFEEFCDKAIEARAAAVEALNELYQGALHDERLAAEQKAESERLAKEREELDRQRKVEEERLRKEREEIERQHAEMQAERDEIEAAMKAEQDRLDAIEREKKEAERQAKLEAEAEQRAKENAEREAKEKAAREAAEKEKREANKRHVTKVNNAAKKAFVKGGLTEEQAETALALITSGSIPKVGISY